eukprot:TRINITY_DN8154_c0_g4_i1.p1 TRINITY_DN8154_c0_g4~~TRINITY_DN8154_c0_g4_i1.p1  ORF type:complete len:163 (+),score=12.40 TRINITY_DN8154_c0_g4_i1:534-1022(+)
MKSKEEMIEYNMRVFGKVPLGIHKGELPKFADNVSTYEYWKIQNLAYPAKEQRQPKESLVNSHRFLKTQNKLSASFNNGLLKAVYAPKITEVTRKVNEVSFSNESLKFPRKTIRRWTNKMQQFLRKDKESLANKTVLYAKKETAVVDCVEIECTRSTKLDNT